MLHWIFIGCALALVLLTILLLAQRLLKSDAGNVREWARIEENVEALRYEYDRAVAAKKANSFFARSTKRLFPTNPPRRRATRSSWRPSRRSP